MWAVIKPHFLTGVNMPILNGKKVVDLEVDGVDGSDYPDFADAYFSYGCYEDGTPLTEEELERLNDLASDVLWEMAFDRLH
jgi:hypothetical protein